MNVVNDDLDGEGGWAMTTMVIVPPCTVGEQEFSDYLVHSTGRPAHRVISSVITLVESSVITLFALCHK